MAPRKPEEIALFGVVSPGIACAVREGAEAAGLPLSTFVGDIIRSAFEDSACAPVGRPDLQVPPALLGVKKCPEVPPPIPEPNPEYTATPTPELLELMHVAAMSSVTGVTAETHALAGELRFRFATPAQQRTVLRRNSTDPQ